MKNKQNEYKNRITDTNHITMTPFLSQKIKLLSLISIILVLYIHSGFHDYPNVFRISKQPKITRNIQA